MAFDHFVESSGQAAPAVVRVYVKLFDLGTVERGPADNLSVNDGHERRGRCDLAAQLILRAAGGPEP